MGFRLMISVIALFLVSCNSSTLRTFHAFGTVVTVELDDVPRDEMDDIYQHIDLQLQDMHNRWHAWQHSELSAIRQACQTGASIQIHQDLVYLIERGQELEKKSLGYFNPAMGELIDLWGFLSHTSTQDREAPDDDDIQEVLSHHPNMQDLHLVGQTLTCTNHHLRLDLGAYAKGYGIQKIMDYLKQRGVKRALINAGGDMMILQESDMPARKIGILSPDKLHPELVLHLKDSTAVFTSGTYARNFRDLKTKKKFHHLINPKTGYPSTAFVSVTVLHPDPVLADAAATALLACDKENWLEIMNSMGIDKYLLITADGERITTLSP